MKEIYIGDIRIELERKRIKNMYLRILPPEGRIHISAPLRIKEEEIKAFVLSKSSWIIKQQEKLHQSYITKELEYETGENIYLWGRKLKLFVIEDNNAGHPIEIEEDSLRMSIKSGSTKKQREALLYSWYRKVLNQEVPALIQYWEKIIGVKASGYTLRNMKTRWGTCNIRTQNICLNLQLAMKSPKCLEYVIVHELVHLLERSHNQVFKHYMDRFLPNWRAIKLDLNKSGIER